MATQEENGRDVIVAQERDRLLASSFFQRSPVLSRLLQYLVDHHLKGGKGAPKAYAIATEALGRNADFDPAVDSYPRVMVGRLRNLLDRYYAENQGTFRLRVPHGSYEIIVQQLDTDLDSESSESKSASASSSVPGAVPSSKTNAGRTDGSMTSVYRGMTAIKAAIVLLALVALLALAAWWLNQSPESPISKALVQEPLIEISTPVAGNSSVSMALSRGLEAKLRDGLRRFGAIRLLSAATKDEGTTNLRPDYRLDSSIVLTVNGPVDVTIVLNRVADERTIWSQQIQIKREEVPAFGPIEPAISKIAGDYGIIVQDQVNREPRNFSPGFPCFAQFNRLRQMRRPEIATPVTQCLRISLQREPANVELLSALSLLRFGDWQPLRSSLAGNRAFVEAQDLATRANEAGSNTAAGLFALARAKFYMRNCEQGISLGEMAIDRNPLDADMVGYFGLFEAACGHIEKGEALLRRSLWLDDTHAGVPAVTLAFMLSERGENDEALAILNRMPSPSNMEPQYLMVRSIVFARKGNMGEAKKLWARLLGYTKQPRDADPETVLQQFMITPTVIKRAAAALRETGVSGSTPPS